MDKWSRLRAQITSRLEQSQRLKTGFSNPQQLTLGRS